MYDPKLSIVDGGPRQYPPSVWAGLKPVFEQRQDHLAIISQHQRFDHLKNVVNDGEENANGHINGNHGSDASLQWTFGQLDTGSTRLAAAFRASGIKTGDTLVTFLPNGADWCLLSVASVKSKLNFTSLDQNATLPPRREELEGFMELLRPEIIVVSNTAQLAAVDAACKTVSAGPTLKILIADAAPPGWTTFEQLVKKAESQVAADVLADALIDDYNRTAITVFTSGTSSGRPKGCPRPVISILHGSGCIDRVDGTTPGRRLIDNANFRVIAQVSILVTLEEGSTYVMSGPAFSPEGFIEAVDKFKITDTLLMPAMARAVISHPTFSKEKVASLHTIGSGGDVITRAVLDMISNSFPNGYGFNISGMSEAGGFYRWPFFNHNLQNKNGDIVYFGEVSSNGFVAEGMRIKVILDGKIVPRGTPGELLYDSYTTIKHYLRGVSPETFLTDEDGSWFRSGDTAIIDEAGHCFIVGRSKDIIKRAGVPITPGAIESCLQPCLDAEVAVFGVEHPILGAEPWAVISDYNGRSEEQIKQQILDKFGKDYELGGVTSLSQLGLESMPLNPSGKIQKLDLQKALATYRS